jgi:putative tricarboxylic transport membrane protein
VAKLVADIVFALALLLGSIYLWFVADAFPRFARYQYVDSDFWPKALLVLIGLLAIGVLYQSIQRLMLYRRQIQLGITGGPLAPTAVSTFSWYRFAFAAALTILYFLGLRYLGFLISTVIYIAVAQNIATYENRWMKFAFPVAFTALVAIVFVTVLSLPLPRGTGVFYQFSRMFY